MEDQPVENEQISEVNPTEIEQAIKMKEMQNLVLRRILKIENPGLPEENDTEHKDDHNQ